MEPSVTKKQKLEKLITDVANGIENSEQDSEYVKERGKTYAEFVKTLKNTSEIEKARREYTEWKNKALGQDNRFLTQKYENGQKCLTFLEEIQKEVFELIEENERLKNELGTTQSSLKDAEKTIEDMRKNVGDFGQNLLNILNPAPNH